jgi:hypothetical protein
VVLNTRLAMEHFLLQYAPGVSPSVHKACKAAMKQKEKNSKHRSQQVPTRGDIHRRPPAASICACLLQHSKRWATTACKGALDIQQEVKRWDKGLDTTLSKVEMTCG